MGLDWLLPALFLTAVFVVLIAREWADMMTCACCRGEKRRRTDKLVQWECGYVIPRELFASGEKAGGTPDVRSSADDKAKASISSILRRQSRR